MRVLFTKNVFVMLLEVNDPGNVHISPQGGVRYAV